GIRVRTHLADTWPTGIPTRGFRVCTRRAGTWPTGIPTRGFYVWTRPTASLGALTRSVTWNRRIRCVCAWNRSVRCAQPTQRAPGSRRGGAIPGDVEAGHHDTRGRRARDLGIAGRRASFQDADAFSGRAPRAA